MPPGPSKSMAGQSRFGAARRPSPIRPVYKSSVLEATTRSRSMRQTAFFPQRTSLAAPAMTCSQAVRATTSCSGKPATTPIFGRGGVDRLFGGGDNDTLIGGAANDIAFGESGNDTFRWDVGDGSDQVEGAAGLDTMVFNGSVTSEMFELAANGNRLRLTRNIGNIVMDVDNVERVDLNASNGIDAVTVSDLTNTDVTLLNISLEAGVGGAGDGLADTVTIKGRQSDDSFQIASFDNGTRVAIATTAFPFITIKGGEATNDRLIVNTLGRRRRRRCREPRRQCDRAHAQRRCRQRRAQHRRR